MFAKVLLLSGYQEPLWYAIPPHLRVEVGDIVQVPLKARYVSALVQSLQTQPPALKTIKEIAAYEPMPADDHFKSFIKKIAHYYHLSPIYLLKRVHNFLQEKQLPELEAVRELEYNRAVSLTPQQALVVQEIETLLTRSGYQPMVIHGVTGSGKTEVYKKALEHILQAQKSALFCLPEVGLAVQFALLFKNHFGSCVVYQCHSGASVTEKKQLWQALLEKRPIIIVGVHQPVLLPIANLGLIIMDEEHEAGYQEKKSPKLHTKDVALLRAHTYNCPIILGSATPSFTSLYNIEHKNWKLFKLYERYAGNFPRIQQVLLTEQKKREHFWLTPPLLQAIEDRLSKKEQIILFLNRRGYSTFVQCKECSFIFSCHQCSVSLTLHESKLLTCHYCAFTQSIPSVCPECGVSERKFLKKGMGTQQLMSMVQSLFPAARVARLDLDVTVQRKKLQKTMDAMHDGTLDILIGTQSVCKGYHFPRVTLVGIIWADINIHFPLYNAPENTLQQLIQVAGRAGRQSINSDVIIQAMSHHALFDYIKEVDYLRFYEYEMNKRKLLRYPPFNRLVHFEMRHSNETIVEREAHQCAELSRRYIQERNYTIELLGPAKPMVYKLKNMHIRSMYCKAASIQEVLYLVEHLKKQSLTSVLVYTPNPVTL